MTARRLFWVLVLTFIPTALRAAEPLEARVEAVLKDPVFASAHWGLLVVDRKTGATVYARNADELFCPASVTKLFTTAAALAELGPDYQFHTPIVRHGDDLILVASGDLALGGRTGPEGTLLFDDGDHTYANGNLTAGVVPANPLTGLEHLARAVKAAGITRVRGDVIVDDRLFEPAESTGSGPSRLSPIVVNDNVIDVVATPAEKAGGPATVKTIPATTFATMDAAVETVAAGETPRLRVRAVGPRRFSVRGRVPVGHKPVVKVYEIEEPASFARTLFLECLRKEGVRVDAAANGENAGDRLPARDEVAKLPKVAEYVSPPFRENVRVILKVSHNLHASTLPLLLAVKHGERTLSAGLRREGSALKTLGVDVATISFGGGAGGDRADLATPRATVALLRAMAERPDFAAYEAALPVLGRDGTLAKAVGPDSPARGHARAKTGTYTVGNGLNGHAVLTSKALAGYLDTADGRPLVFAFFLNEVPLKVSGDEVNQVTAAAGRLLGRLCEVFYSDR